MHYIHKANGIDASHLKMIDTLNGLVATHATDIKNIKAKIESN